jgi:hypothetical protein
VTAPSLTRGRAPVADRIPDFSGGLNSVSTADSLGPNQVSDALNARLTQFGAVVKRGGTQRIHTSAIHSSGIQGVTEWALSDGTRYVITVANGVLYWATYGAFPITFTSVASGLATTGKVMFAAFRDGSGDALYIGDGGQLNKLTVAAGPIFTLTTNLTDTPGVREIVVFNQRLWSCGCANFPQSIFYSSLNNGDTLGVGASDGGQIVVRTFGQQNVTALLALGTSLLIFHRGGVSRLTGFGQDDIIAVPAGVTGDVGTFAPAGVVRVGNVAYYVNVRGLFIGTADGVAPVNTPEKPDPTSQGLALITETELGNVSAVYNEATRELLITIPTRGTFVYQTVLGSWSGPWDGAYLSTGYLPYTQAGDANNEPIILKGNPSGFLELLDAADAFTDAVSASGTAGSQIAMRVTARRFFFGDFASAKAFRFGYVLADLDGSENCALGFQTDISGGTVALTQGALTLLVTEAGDEMVTESGVFLAEATTVQSLRVPMWGTGYYMDVTIEDLSLDSAPTFSRIEVTGFALGRR